MRCVLLALIAGSFAVPVRAAEHAANGDFEVLGDDGLPAQWAYIAAEDGEGAIEVAEGIETGTCAKVVCTRTDGRWGPGLGQTGVVEAEGGQWYELSFWAKQEGIASGVIAALRNMQDWDANHVWQHVYPGPEWRRFSAKFQAPYDLSRDVSRLQFSFDSTGTLWLDRVTLTETERPRSPNLIDVGRTTNRVPNSSFEVGTFGWGTYGTTFLVGEVDGSTAYHGKRSFRLDVAAERLPIHWNDFTYALRGKPSHAPPPSVSLVTHGYLPVTPGERMVVSAYVKADRPGGQVRLGLLEEDGTDRTNMVDVGTEWTRIVVPAGPATEMAFVRVELVRGDGPTAPDTLWVDAVQLERGPRATTYEPALPVEVGFELPRDEHLYEVGKPAAMRVLTYNATGVERTTDLHLSVEGFLRETVAEATRSIAAAPGAVTAAQVGLPDLADPPKAVRDPGFYRLHVTWEDEAGPQERGLRFAVTHPLAGGDTCLGQNHSFVTDRLMRLTQEAGTSWVRSWFVRWDDIEPKPGEFDFAEADAQLDRLERLGFHVQLVLPDPSSEWASTAPTALSETTGAEAESRRVWWMPSDMQAFEDYVAALFDRYGERVRHWEVFNEPVNRKGGPDGNLEFERSYLRFLQAVQRAKQRTGADVEIMGAGLGYLKDIEDISPILSAIDILSEHRYPSLGSAQGFQDSIRGAVETMREHAATRPIWMTEYGIYADDDPDPTTLSSRFLIHAGDDSEMLAAVATVKHQVVALANGTEKVFFHIGNWPIILNREHGCGFHPFFEWSGIPRKMLVTQNVLGWAIPPDTTESRVLSAEPPVMVYEFRQPEESVFILWATEPRPVDGKLRELLGRDGGAAYDVVGRRERSLREANEYPVYIRVSRARADGMGDALAAWAGQEP